MTKINPFDLPEKVFYEEQARVLSGEITVGFATNELRDLNKNVVPILGDKSNLIGFAFLFKKDTEIKALYYLDRNTPEVFDVEVGFKRWLIPVENIVLHDQFVDHLKLTDDLWWKDKLKPLKVGK